MDMPPVSALLSHSLIRGLPALAMAEFRLLRAVEPSRRAIEPGLPGTAPRSPGLVTFQVQRGFSVAFGYSRDAEPECAAFTTRLSSSKSSARGGSSSC